MKEITTKTRKPVLYSKLCEEQRCDKATPRTPILSLTALFDGTACTWRQSWQYKQTLPKAQQTRGLSSAYQSNFFRSYHKFLHKYWSNIFRISTKHQLQILNQTSAFRQSKPSFRISTKIELHNHNQAQQQNNVQTSASKSCLNINFKILNKPWNLVLKVQTKT